MNLDKIWKFVITDKGSTFIFQRYRYEHFLVFQPASYMGTDDDLMNLPEQMSLYDVAVFTKRYKKSASIKFHPTAFETIEMMRKRMGGTIRFDWDVSAETKVQLKNLHDIALWYGKKSILLDTFEWLSLVSAWMSIIHGPQSFSDFLDAYLIELESLRQKTDDNTAVQIDMQQTLCCVASAMGACTRYSACKFLSCRRHPRSYTTSQFLETCKNWVNPKPWTDYCKIFQQAGPKYFNWKVFLTNYPYIDTGDKRLCIHGWADDPDAVQEALGVFKSVALMLFPVRDPIHYQLAHEETFTIFDGYNAFWFREFLIKGDIKVNGDIDDSYVWVNDKWTQYIPDDLWLKYGNAVGVWFVNHHVIEDY